MAALVAAVTASAFGFGGFQDAQEAFAGMIFLRAAIFIWIVFYLAIFAATVVLITLLARVSCHFLSKTWQRRLAIDPEADGE